MSTAPVRASLCSFLTDSSFSKDSERVKSGKEQVRKFLQSLNDDDRLHFDTFAKTLMTALEKHFACVSSECPCRSKSALKEVIWRTFHNLRTEELPKLWNGLWLHGFLN